MSGFCAFCSSSSRRFDLTSMSKIPPQFRGFFFERVQLGFDFVILSGNRHAAILTEADTRFKHTVEFVLKREHFGFIGGLFMVIAQKVEHAVNQHIAQLAVGA